MIESIIYAYVIWLSTYPFLWLDYRKIPPARKGTWFGLLSLGSVAFPLFALHEPAKWIALGLGCVCIVALAIKVTRAKA